MRQIFVMCPFCTKVFDVKDEPSVRLVIDNKERWAHFRCVPISVEQPEQRKEAAE